MARRRLVIIGAGGQGREIAAFVRDLNKVEPVFETLGYVVTDVSKLGAFDVQDVLGDYGWLEKNLRRIDALVLGIGSPSARLRIAAELRASFPSLEWPTMIHPTAIVDRHTLRMEQGAVISAGVVGTVNLTLREFSFVNFGATLGHEATLGRGTVVNPGANISGGVELGESVLVGTGAQVLQYLKVGDGATVGGGAVVTKDVPGGITVVGVPARPMGTPEKPR